MASSEAAVVRRIRALIALMVVLGAAAVSVGHPPVQFWVTLFFVPGLWTFARPRWPAIVVWILWTCSFGLLAFMGSMLAPSPPPASLVLVGLMLVLLVVGLPLVRRTHESPRRVGVGRLPVARTRP